ncbi:MULTISPECIES: hypothetical protein [unclassified Cellulophaga]|uniref:hypothetical protein n=1 Tax=unclassified Cellulophaga TaxID=2634405 RepID=UPI0026E21CBD|nr:MULTISPECIES: hypothetical protein [unclassified Cellulophaga]MDO6491946.1 hypothetical protein [Cellulophaga sp. 2_MG-2023]MDO6495399.1 hypothetical protein [Cellulophaga sp. 3_MG-2023]
MKKITFVMVLMLGILTISAQESKKKTKDAKHKMHKRKDGKRAMHKMAKFTPEQRAILQTKKMTLALDLSEEQQSKIEKLNLKNAELFHQKAEKRKARKEADKKLTSNEKFAMTNEKLDLQIAQKKALKKILSKDQYAQWNKVYKKRHHSPEKRKVNRRQMMLKRNKTIRS